ncbi:hypothetical protein KA111_01370 [Candidatus Woesebacteria bacterium]|nr:hypothetical protein [Candidatus Woesebacteria bacterium]
MRKLYWYLTGFAKKHGLIFIVSIVGAVAIFSVFIPTLVSSLETKKRNYVGLVGNYTIDSLPREVTEKISAGLTSINKDGSASPLLSQRWSVEQDGKTYRFILRDDIFWRDGKKLEPDDIKYNFDNVETIITPNDIVFKLPDSYAPFPTIVSEPVVRKEDEKYNFFFTRPTLIGVGKYKISDYETKGQRITEVTLDSKDDRYIYRFYLTENDAVLAFKHGEVDILENLSKKYDIFEWPNVNLKEDLNNNKYLAIFFNIRNSFFQKNIRQALAYAIETPEDNSRSYGPINPDSWAYLQAGKNYNKDLDRAVERILDEVPQEKMEFELTTTSLYEAEAEKIKSEWEELGKRVFESCPKSDKVSQKVLCENTKISVKIRISNFPDTNNFQLMLIGQESPPDPDQYYLWHSEQSSNFSGYKNTRIDNLLEKGRQTFGQKERVEIYEEFQQFFLEDAPAIFIRHLYSYDISRK